MSKQSKNINGITGQVQIKLRISLLRSFERVDITNNKFSNFACIEEYNIKLI